jgi:hypothetical protein
VRRIGASSHGIAVSAVLVTVALPGCGSASRTAQESTPRLPLQATVSTIAAGTTTRVTALADTIPTPLPATERRAIHLLHASHALARLVHGVSYRIAHRGPWTTGGSNDRLVGMVFWLDLDHTTDLAGTWPTAVYDAKRFPPYREQSESFKAFDVGVLFVEVDLVLGRVAGVTPSPPQPEHAEGVGGPTTIHVEPPTAVARTGGRQLAEFYFGRSVTAQSGCLACHRIGQAGNNGPGPDLTHVGSRLSSRRVERAILNPTAPMPSFRYLPKAKLRAVVTFLSLLRG